MAKRTLETVLKQVQALTPEEQRQVRDTLDALLAPVAAPITEDEFEWRMVAAGIMTAPVPPPPDLEPDEEWEPIEVSGPPVSQTIIDERR